MKSLFFGTAGIPSSTPKPSSANGIRKCRELNLDAMELEFVHGVKMKEGAAKEVNAAREENDLVLTAHAPYYINLNAKEPEKREASRTRIIHTAEIANLCGAYSITFHPSFYMGMDKEEVYKTTKQQLEKAVQEIKDKGIKLWVRPELTGKPTAFGDIWEIIRLSQEIDQVLPCIDFSHMHARTNGKWNSYKEFCTILEEMETKLGKDALHNMHCHVSGIEYSEKGERNHLFLEKSDLKYKELMKALKEFGCKGVVIAESPDPQVDALLLQKTYNSL